MTKKSVRSLSVLLLAAILVTSLLTGCSPASPAASPAGGSKKLVVYAALNEADIVEIQKKFKEDTGIEIEYIRAGAGDVAARVLAEKASPKADVMVGGSVDVYEPLAKDGLFEKYVSPNSKELAATFNDPNQYWQGWYMGVLALVVNKDRFDKELKPQRLQIPATWDDLLDPRYKNVFVSSNPVTAGGAYIFIADQIFRLGEDKAWDYLKELDKNVHHYYKGAVDCISPVATGEFIVGMSWGHDIYNAVKQGYPIEVVIPKQTAFEIGGAAVVKGGKNIDNAKKFIDWLLTKEVGEMNTSISNRYSVRKDVTPPKGLPKLEEVDLVKYDRAKAGAMKPDVVKKFDEEIASKR
ncbi:MAG TPA: ABC transporter substrate-binding protein [Clostridia bacterium]|nr:ABC transporter substrate-binding protein [Clostridia bacterium]